ncbi:MAG: hypothetical protein WBL21_00705 [Salinimicrobium sp.]
MKNRILLNLIALVITFSFTGCSTDEQVENSLGGDWVEVYPQTERTRLLFSANNTMTLTETDSKETKVFTFRIEGDEIFLIPEGSETETSLSFDKLAPGRFNIGYLYPSIEESDPDKFMTFERLP